MSTKLNKDQQQEIDWAIAQVELLPPGRGAQASVWARIRSAGLALRDSLNGRAPLYGESKLIALAEGINVWYPAPQRLVDLATDLETRAGAEDWIRRAAAEQVKDDEAEAAYHRKRADVLRTLTGDIVPNSSGRSVGGGGVVLTEDIQEQTGLREAELAWHRAHVANCELLKRFGEWRIRMWVQGKLRSTKGTW